MPPDLSTDSVSVDFEVERPFQQSWRIVLEEGPMRSDYPQMGARLRLDSVRSADGTLYDITSREARRVMNDPVPPVLQESKSDVVTVRITDDA
ncbi:MAG: hypothetical protein ACQETP_02860 [Bacteroidota bacterium]